MSRYLIIDTHDMAIPKMGQFGRVLSEEETMAKFKEIWKHGFDSQDRYGLTTKEEEWAFEELKKTL